MSTRRTEYKNVRTRKAPARKAGYVSARAPARQMAVRTRAPKTQHGLGNNRQELNRRLKKGGHYVIDNFEDLNNSKKFNVGTWLGDGLAEGGRWLGSSIGKLFGFGDYRFNNGTRIKNNSLIRGRDSRIRGNQVPMFGNGVRSNVFTHREYIGDIVSSTDFAITDFQLQPGLTDIFPWLEGVADNYEEWRPIGIMCEFKSLSSDSVVSSSTSTTLGSVIMATEYNSAAVPFTTKLEMENHQYATSAKPSESFLHPVECNPHDNPVNVFYIRDGDAPANTDIRLYDLGRFSVATAGMQTDGDVIGELWVTYQIEMLKPKLKFQDDDPDILSTHYILPTTIASGQYFGTTPPSAPEAGSTFEVTLLPTTIVWPSSITAGSWMMRYQARGTSATLTTGLTVACTTNCSDLKILVNSTSANANQVDGVASNLQYIEKFFKITGPDAVLTFSGGTMPSSITSGDLIITQLNSQILTGIPKTPRYRLQSANMNFPNRKRVCRTDKQALQNPRLRKGQETDPITPEQKATRYQMYSVDDSKYSPEEIAEHEQHERNRELDELRAWKADQEEQRALERGRRPTSPTPSEKNTFEMVSKPKEVGFRVSSKK